MALLEVTHIQKLNSVPVGSSSRLALSKTKKQLGNGAKNKAENDDGSNAVSPVNTPERHLWLLLHAPVILIPVTEPGSVKLVRLPTIEVDGNTFRSYQKTQGKQSRNGSSTSLRATHCQCISSSDQSERIWLIIAAERGEVERKRASTLHLLAEADLGQWLEPVRDAQASTIVDIVVGDLPESMENSLVNLPVTRLHTAEFKSWLIYKNLNLADS